MKHFSCGAVVPGCAMTFTANTDDEILSQVARHVAHAHDLRTIPHDVVDAVRANIREVN